MTISNYEQQAKESGREYMTGGTPSGVSAVNVHAEMLLHMALAVPPEVDADGTIERWGAELEDELGLLRAPRR